MLQKVAKSKKNLPNQKRVHEQSPEKFKAPICQNVAKKDRWHQAKKFALSLANTVLYFIGSKIKESANLEPAGQELVLKVAPIFQERALSHSLRFSEPCLVRCLQRQLV